MCSWKPLSAGGGKMQYSSPAYFVCSPHSPGVRCIGPAATGPFGSAGGAAYIIVGGSAPLPAVPVGAGCMFTGCIVGCIVGCCVGCCWTGAAAPAIGGAMTGWVGTVCVGMLGGRAVD